MPPAGVQSAQGVSSAVGIGAAGSMHTGGSTDSSQVKPPQHGPLEPQISPGSVQSSAKAGEPPDGSWPQAEINKHEAANSRWVLSGVISFSLLTAGFCRVGGLRLEDTQGRCLRVVTDQSAAARSAGATDIAFLGAVQGLGSAGQGETEGQR